MGAGRLAGGDQLRAGPVDAHDRADWCRAFSCDGSARARIDPGHGFLERSTMLSARRWEHERTLHPLEDGGTRLTDRVAFVPRMPRTAPTHRAAIAAIFRHRHRRLERVFGAR